MRTAFITIVSGLALAACGFAADAQDNGQPLEGTCEGQMACSTCHVIVAAEDFAKLPPASEEEEDMLDLAAHATRTSRLACQIIITADMGTLSVRIPPSARNWLRG